MPTVVLTGSASGIGAAVRRRLEDAGTRVLGVDVRDAEVVGDLGDGDGRAATIAAIRTVASDGLDGLVACAGLGPQVADAPRIVSVNFFGAIAVLEGLRDLLVLRRGAAVAVSSNSAIIPSSDNEIAEACLDGDESAARRHAGSAGGTPAYGGSKLALARWVRRQAPSASWAGSHVRLNAVAPGAALTPLLTEGLEHPLLGPAIRQFPIPLGGFASADDIAGAITFLLGRDAAFCCGTVLFADGGTDALLRGDRF